MTITPLGDQLNINTLIISVAATLIGWLAADLRSRLTNVEKKTAAIITGMFYLIIKDSNAPAEARRAIEEAMRLK